MGSLAKHSASAISARYCDVEGGYEGTG